MASTVYTFQVRDSGTLQAGLTPTWSTLRKLSDGTAISSPSTAAPIAELAGGLYKVTFDPEGANGEAAGVIDAGSGIAADADRYIALTLARDSSILSTLNPAPYAALGIRIRSESIDDNYIPVIAGDDKSVVLLFEDEDANPVAIPTGATAAMLDSAGNAVGTATVTSSNEETGYLLVRLQVDANANMPSTLRITFAGGAGGAYSQDISMRAWS